MSDQLTYGMDNVQTDATTDRTDDVWTECDFARNLCREFTVFSPLSYLGILMCVSADGDGEDYGLSDVQQWMKVD